MNTVGTIIRKHREDRGITQDYIANEMGITQSTYGRLEKSDKRLSVDRLIEIAKDWTYLFPSFLERKQVISFTKTMVIMRKLKLEPLSSKTKIILPHSKRK